MLYADFQELIQSVVLYLENGARNRIVTKLRCSPHISRVADILSFSFPTIKAAREIILLGIVSLLTLRLSCAFSG